MRIEQHLLQISSCVLILILLLLLLLHSSSSERIKVERIAGLLLLRLCEVVPLVTRSKAHVPALVTLLEHVIALLRERTECAVVLRLRLHIAEPRKQIDVVALYLRR